jgi:pimeloyl-ACP methyl ester carboxylesterase
MLIPFLYIEGLCRAPLPGYTPRYSYPSLAEPSEKRAESASWLTYPEWHIVYSAESLGRHLQTRPPSDYPYWQDVRGFWRWMQRQAGDADGPALALAEAMVGRHIDGAPFTALGNQEIPGTVNKPNYPRNDFTYARDRAGTVCPIGAHIRRANPRTGDYPTGRTGLIKRLLSLLGLTGTAEDDRIASTRFHRILRRGREYGTDLERHEALKPDALISIAPPAGRWDFAAIEPPSCPWLVIQGEQDEIVEPQAVYDWIDKLRNPPELIRMPETSHFFHRKLMDLRGAIKHAMKAWLPEA